MENEFGFVGPNEKYMRHLVHTARASLGDAALIYTTDPPPNIAKGSLPGDEVYRWRAPPNPQSATQTLNPKYASSVMVASQSCSRTPVHG